MEYLKDFDFELKYHSGKANNMVDVLSRKEMHKVELIMSGYDLLDKFWNLNVQFAWNPTGVLMGNLNVIFELREMIRPSQLLDERLHAMSTQPCFT